MAAVIGAVMAGGAGTRMGVPKATAELAGRPLIEYPLEAVARAGLEAVVVAKAASALPALDAPIWHEPDGPLHPLAGIVAALERANGPIVAVACDMPFVAPELIAHLASLAHPLAVPALDGRYHPLLARYEPSLAGTLAEALAAARPLQETVEQLGPVVLDERALARFGDPRELLFNVNTPGDLRRAEAKLG